MQARLALEQGYPHPAGNTEAVLALEWGGGGGEGDLYIQEVVCATFRKCVCGSALGLFPLPRESRGGKGALLNCCIWRLSDGARSVTLRSLPLTLCAALSESLSVRAPTNERGPLTLCAVCSDRLPPYPLIGAM